MANILVWYRSDLRVYDHAPLVSAVEEARSSQGRVHATFIYSEAQLRGHDNGPTRLAVVQTAVERLKQALQERGITLKVIHSESWLNGVEALIEYCKTHNIHRVYGHREPGYNELQRDAYFASLAQSANIVHKVWEDACLVPPEQLLNGQGGFYKVFTAYKKRWLATIADYLSAPLSAPQVVAQVSPQADEPWQRFEWTNPLNIPVTEQQAQERIETFMARSGDYGKERDLPSVNGTSQLSVALSIGTISSRQIMAHSLHRRDEGTQKWVSEIIWREFYKYLLYWRPELCLHKPFDKKWDAFPWQHDDATLVRWQQGKTGVPIVDAGMRQLTETGWMHNRVRMITAMYLVKILKQDWRLGEAWFAQQLADYDFASNNGGWQWCASTGVDAAPYFRIFNPYQQAKRFDPEGRYIRTYVKELANLPATSFHKETALPVASYPKPVCNYAEERSRTLEQFKLLGHLHDTDR